MIGGYNHIDVEPMTVSDTNIMKSILQLAVVAPAVVIYHNGMNVRLHYQGCPMGWTLLKMGKRSFDLYMKNSTSLARALQRFISSIRTWF